MSEMITTMPASVRMSMSLRPKRSASRPKSGQDARDRRSGRGDQPRPERNAAGVRDAELADVERHEGRGELEADEGDEDAERQGPDVAPPGLLDQSPRQ
jgi:hypothetical protein